MPERPAFAHAYVALRPAPGKSRPGRLNVANVRDYHAREDLVEEVARALEQEGFVVTGKSPLGVAVAAPPEIVGKTFATRLVAKPYQPVARRVQAGAGPSRRAPEPVTFTHFHAETAMAVPSRLADLVDHVRPAPRVRYFALPDAPDLTYHHLDVPEDVARLMDASAAHDRGVTGAGIRLAVIDTGFHPHEWYRTHGFKVTLVGRNHPEDDTVGHGTGIMTCAMAVAPGAEFYGVKLDDDAAAAFQRARTVNPHVISCSWGLWGFDRDLHDEIVDAVAHGVVVCFACGNGPGGAAWPGAMPEVVSVGGVYVDERGQLEASSYASSGTNPDEPGRRCPDVCGLTGQMPHGIYIAMPTQEGSDLDSEFAAKGARFPDGDGTGAADGWLVASGTSSATPAVAGVAALILQAEPGLSPEEVKKRLAASCRDVTVGRSANGDAAGEGPDEATGSGLADAFLAVHPLDVWVKDSPDDNGTVPDTYPAAWTSPDIWVRPAADHGLDAGHRPEPGRANWVYVRVRNRGRAPAGDVRVQLFWTEPSLAVSWPAGWRSEGIKVDGAPGNVRTIAKIPAGGEAVTEPFEWWPPGPAFLAARVDCPDDPVTREGDVPADNNLAARHLLAAEVPPGEEAAFTLRVERPRGRRGPAVLVVDRGGAPKAAVGLEPAAVGAGPHAGMAVRLDAGAGAGFRPDAGAGPPSAARLGHEPALPDASPETNGVPWAPLTTCDLARKKAPPPALRKVRNVESKVLAVPLDLVRGADQRITVRVKVPPKAEGGTRYTVRLDQRVGAATTGHATLVVRVAEAVAGTGGE